MEEQGKSHYDKSGNLILSFDGNLTVTFEKYAELVRVIDQIHHGRVTIFIQDGKPVRIEEVIKSTKL